ncbi:MAG: hypothetical protein AB7I25_00155 [Vicinamibacterales bacterium]
MPQPGAIVVDVIKQPPITQEISVADVVLGAVGLTGTIMLGALIAGLLVGLAVVGVKVYRARKDRA